MDQATACFAEMHSRLNFLIEYNSEVLHRKTQNGIHIEIQESHAIVQVKPLKFPIKSTRNVHFFKLNFVSYICQNLTIIQTLYSNWVCFASSALRRNGARNLNKSSNSC